MICQSLTSGWAGAGTLSMASAVSLCPPPPAPAPAPGRVLMRPLRGEAGEEAAPTGASRSFRGGQSQAWRHFAPACLLPPRGMVADTPLGWGGGPCTCLCPSKTPPWRPRVCLLPSFPPDSQSLGGAGGAQGVPGLTGSTEGRAPWGRGQSRSLKALGTWSSFIFCYLCAGSLGLWLFSFLSLVDSEVKEFVV